MDSDFEEMELHSKDLSAYLHPFSKETIVLVVADPDVGTCSTTSSLHGFTSSTMSVCVCVCGLLLLVVVVLVFGWQG